MALQLPYDERYWDEVVVKFLLENSPEDPGVPTERPDDGNPDVNTLFFTIQHDAACDSQLL